MKPSTTLYSLLALMQVLILAQSTFLAVEWSGIVMWLSTIIFLVATGVFVQSQSSERKNRKS